MMLLFPLFWVLSKSFREDYRLFHQDRGKWQNRQAERFAQDFVERYKEILDRFE